MRYYVQIISAGNTSYHDITADGYEIEMIGTAFAEFTFVIGEAIVKRILVSAHHSITIATGSNTLPTVKQPTCG